MFELKFDIDGLQETIRLSEQQITGARLKKPLSALGKVLRTDTKARIASGDGYPPLAENTVTKRQRTGTSLITKHGGVRKIKEANIERTVKRLQGYIAWTKNRYFGLGRFLKMPAAAEKKIKRWQRQLEQLNAALVRAQDTAYVDRKIGKTVHEKASGRLLGRIPDTIHFLVQVGDTGGVLFLRSRWRKQAAVRAHDQGDGHVPRRQIFKLTTEHIRKFRVILVEHGLAVWNGEGG